MEKEKVGSKKDLEERIRGSNDLLLVRAINESELSQLLKDGPNSFVFHSGTQYDSRYSYLVEEKAESRDGTVIVYNPSKTDIATIKDSDCYEKRFVLNGWYYCVNNFKGPVEVYNIYRDDLINTEFIESESIL